MPRLRPMSSSDRVRRHRRRLRAAIVGAAAVQAARFLAAVVADADAAPQVRISAARVLVGAAVQLASKPALDDGPRENVRAVLARICVPPASGGTVANDAVNPPPTCGNRAQDPARCDGCE